MRASWRKDRVVKQRQTIGDHKKQMPRSMVAEMVARSPLGFRGFKGRLRRAVRKCELKGFFIELERHGRIGPGRRRLPSRSSSLRQSTAETQGASALTVRMRGDLSGSRSKCTKAMVPNNLSGNSSSLLPSRT